MNVWQQKEALYIVETMILLSSLSNLKTAGKIIDFAQYIENNRGTNH